MGVCVVCVYVSVATCEVQKVSGPLELEVQAVVDCLVRVLGTEHGFSIRAAVLLTAEPSLQSPPCFKDVESKNSD